MLSRLNQQHHTCPHLEAICAQRSITFEDQAVMQHTNDAHLTPHQCKTHMLRFWCCIVMQAQAGTEEGGGLCTCHHAGKAHIGEDYGEEPPCEAEACDATKAALRVRAVWLVHTA